MMSEQTYVCVECGREVDILEIVSKALKDGKIQEPEEISNRKTLAKIWKCPSCDGKLKVLEGTEHL